MFSFDFIEKIEQNGLILKAEVPFFVRAASADLIFDIIIAEKCARGKSILTAVKRQVVDFARMQAASEFCKGASVKKLTSKRLFCEKIDISCEKVNTLFLQKALKTAAI